MISYIYQNHIFPGWKTILLSIGPTIDNIGQHFPMRSTFANIRPTFANMRPVFANIGQKLGNNFMLPGFFNLHILIAFFNTFNIYSLNFCFNSFTPPWDTSGVMCNCFIRQWDPMVGQNSIFYQALRTKASSKLRGSVPNIS